MREVIVTVATALIVLSLAVIVASAIIGVGYRLVSWIIGA